MLKSCVRKKVFWAFILWTVTLVAVLVRNNTGTKSEELMKEFCRAVRAGNSRQILSCFDDKTISEYDEVSDEILFSDMYYILGIDEKADDLKLYYSLREPKDSDKNYMIASIQISYRTSDAPEAGRKASLNSFHLTDDGGRWHLSQ